MVLYTIYTANKYTADAAEFVDRRAADKCSAVNCTAGLQANVPSCRQKANVPSCRQKANMPSSRQKANVPSCQSCSKGVSGTSSLVFRICYNL